MCIYCGTKHYRKIYEHHHGIIPKDELGKSYHVHHIDGRRTNNSPDNLVALSLQEHYDIHYAQGDWAAALYLAKLLEKPTSDLKDIRAKQVMPRGEKHHRWGIPHTEEVKLHLSKVSSGVPKPGTSAKLKGRKRPEHSIAQSGKNNSRFDPTTRIWENINTGEVVELTRFDFQSMSGAHQASVSDVLNGRAKSCKGWRLVKPETSE
jgi:hypothetical protein